MLIIGRYLRLEVVAMRAHSSAARACGLPGVESVGRAQLEGRRRPGRDGSKKKEETPPGGHVGSIFRDQAFRLKIGFFRVAL